MTKNLLLARIALGAVLCFVASCWASDFGVPFFSGGGSGSGKVAQLQFRVSDGFAATSIVWSPDGKYIATSGTHTNQLHIWDVEQRKLIKELVLPYSPGGRFHNLAWSPDGRYLALCDGFEAQLLVYRTSDWVVAKRFGMEQARGCQKPIFSSDGSELTIFAADLVTFATSDWRELRRLKSSIYDDQLPGRRLNLTWPFLIQDIAYIGNSHSLVIGGGQYESGVVEACGNSPPEYTGRVWIIEPDDKALTRSFVIHCSPISGGKVTHVVSDLIGSRLVLSVLEAVNTTTVRVIDASSGKLLAMPLKGYGDAIPQAMTYTPDDRILLIGGNDGDRPGPVYILDANTLNVLDVVHAVSRVRDIAVHPKSTMFATASFDGFTVWKFTSQSGR